MDRKKRILIASGGTGGHFYPGFAIAQELRKRNWQIVFLVKKNDPALEAIEDNNFASCQLDMQRSEEHTSELQSH